LASDSEVANKKAAGSSKTGGFLVWMVWAGLALGRSRSVGAAQHFGAFRDSFPIIEGAGGDALEVSLHGIDPILHPAS
jgi:hypothetical protein